jgi:flagellar motility protein MotE (MotC chaperone)
MAGKTKRLAKTVVALAATVLAQKAVEKALKSRPIRKKATQLQKAVRERALATGKVVRERARATGKEASKKVKRLVKAAG